MASEAAAQKKRKYLNDPSLRVRIVPMFSDNYGAFGAPWVSLPACGLMCDGVAGYVVVDEVNNTMFAVDPAEPDKILPVLHEEEKLRKREFLGILTTHKHACVAFASTVCDSMRALTVSYFFVMQGPRGRQLGDGGAVPEPDGHWPSQRNDPGLQQASHGWRKVQDWSHQDQGAVGAVPHARAPCLRGVGRPRNSAAPFPRRHAVRWRLWSFL